MAPRMHGNLPGKTRLARAYMLAAEQKPLRIWEDILIFHRRRTRMGAMAASQREEGVRPGRPPLFRTGVGSGSSKMGEVEFRFPPGFGDGEKATKMSEVTFRFPPGFIEEKETIGRTASTSLPTTPPPSARMTVKRGLKDVDALSEHSNTTEVRERRRKLAKTGKIQQYLTSTPQVRPGRGSEEESEVTFRFPPGFIEGGEVKRSGSTSLLTPPPSDRKPAKRRLEDEVGREDMKAFLGDSDDEEVPERRGRRGKRARHESIATQELRPRPLAGASGEIEVIEID